jgi:hypothetical protein
VRAAAEPIDSSGHDVDERVWCAGKHQRVAALKLYQELGFPALQKGGQDKKLVGYFQADTGTINQLVHLWRFDDDDRRSKFGSKGTTLRTFPNTEAAVRQRKSDRAPLGRPPAG